MVVTSNILLHKAIHYSQYQELVDMAQNTSSTLLRQKEKLTPYYTLDRQTIRNCLLLLSSPQHRTF
jgi:hypothetical protein